MTPSASPDTLFATAQKILLAPYLIETLQIEQVFNSMLAHRLDYADLYFSTAAPRAGL
jgi:TldD protein